MSYSYAVETVQQKAQDSQAIPPRPYPDLDIGLADNGVRWTHVSLIIPPELDEKTWAAIGSRLIGAHDMLNWWRGDWAAFGLAHFDNGRLKYRVLTEYAAANDTPYQTIANYASVSRRVHSSRRREDLSWSHHEAVALLAPGDQSRWLKRAAEQKLSVSSLRRLIHISQGDEDGLSNDGPVLSGVRRHLDALTIQFRQLPDPANDVRQFWTPDRRVAWKSWLQPVVEFAMKL